MRRLPIVVPVALFALCASPAVLAQDDGCPPPGMWTVPGEPEKAPLVTADIVSIASNAQVVLLGERHDSMDHHRWQLQTLAALWGQPGPLVLALEMFPREVQPALDLWVAGELTEKEFLRESGWSRHWRFDPRLYLPLFHFARMNRIPMIAVNVDSALTRRVAEEGFDAVSELRTMGISRPAPPSQSYRDYLEGSFAQHPGAAAEQGEGAREERFQRFVESQLTWDRAMAAGIAEALQRYPGKRVVGVLGSGHVIHGWGVPRQLNDLGVSTVVTLLPSDAHGRCADWPSGLATAVFGVVPGKDPAAVPPRLGVWLAPHEQGVSIRDVVEDSVAATAGLRAGDVLLQVAGKPCRQAEDVIDRVRAQPPGSWLPMQVLRDGQVLEVVARFPAEP